MSDSDDPGQDRPRAKPAKANRRSALVKAWRNPFYRFVARFLMYLAFVSYLFPRFRFGFPELIRWASESAAAIVYWTVSPFANDVRHFDAVVTLGDFNITVIDECTGIYEMLIYAAGVFAYPARLRDKAVGLVLGIPILYGLNVFRILMLLLVGYQFPISFEFMHVYFWQATLVLMVMAVWLLWVIIIVPNDTTHTPDHA